jgi:hypothetical protein
MYKNADDISDEEKTKVQQLVTEQFLNDVQLVLKGLVGREVGV